MPGLPKDLFAPFCSAVVFQYYFYRYLQGKSWHFVWKCTNIFGYILPMRTKILFWCEQFGPSVGGGEVWALRYIAAMEQRGYQLEVLAADGSDRSATIEWYGRTPVHRLAAGEALRGNNAEAFRASLAEVARIVARFRPDLLHLSGLSAPSLLLLLMSQGILREHADRAVPEFPRTLASLHCVWPQQFALAGSPLERVLKRMDWTCAFSHSTLDWAQTAWPWLSKRSSVIAHAMPHSLQTQPDVYPQAGASPTIAFVGRLSREKGADLALEAFRLVLREVPGAHLVIAGEGQERSALEALAQTLGLAGSVTFTGWLTPETVRTTMRAANLIMIPSRQESFSLVALEAAHAGRPVVATMAGGLPEVCIDKETALLCPTEDPEALAACTLRLLRDPELARRMGNAARARVIHHAITWDEHVEAYVSLIERLVAPRTLLSQQTSASTSPLPL